MKAIVFLCLLHAVFHESVQFSWPDWSKSGNDSDHSQFDVCVADHAGCGCCVMNSNIDRMKIYFNKTAEKMSEYLQKFKTAVNKIKDSRSAFSVALNNDEDLSCKGPYDVDKTIQYEYVFINFGMGYNISQGVFTAPQSGVYSIAVTIYSNNFTGVAAMSNYTCVNLQVNGTATELLDKFKGDPEDSNTVVIVVKLRAGDQVEVVLLQGCVICDNKNHFNTFTGFLVYTTDEMS